MDKIASFYSNLLGFAVQNLQDKQKITSAIQNTQIGFRFSLTPPKNYSAMSKNVINLSVRTIKEGKRFRNFVFLSEIHFNNDLQF